MEITTRFGRKINTPVIRTSSARKAKKDSHLALSWMLEETKKEWKDSEYILQLLKGININNLSQSDQDVLFDLLLPDGHTRYIFELIS